MPNVMLNSKKYSRNLGKMKKALQFLQLHLKMADFGTKTVHSALLAELRIDVTFSYAKLRVKSKCSVYCKWVNFRCSIIFW